MSEVNIFIKKVRVANFEQDETHKKLWEKFKIENVMGFDNNKSSRVRDVNTCTYVGQVNTYYSTKNSMLSTLWDQGNGYNDQLTNSSCPNTGTRTNGRVWAGCVPVAVAQVMRYWQYPNSYNWSQMLQFQGTPETARLIKDLGLGANLNVSYACDGSYAYTSDVPKTFENFGYPKPSYSPYNYFTVKSDLNSNRPVILSGGSKGKWWIFNSYEDGHCWVTDGFQEDMYYTCQLDPNTPGQYIEQYAGYYDARLYMNWGWNGSWNGWYSSTNFTAGGFNFNYLPKMVTNIRKP
jgi:Peptidase C10 family